MAARSKLTVESPTRLGAKRLAEFMIEEGGRNRQLKQALQMAVAAETGSSELAHQNRKRFATIARSEAFVSSEKARELRAELELLKGAIIETIGTSNPKLAAELLRRFPDDDSGIYDGLVLAANDALGREGRRELRALLEQRHRKHMVSEKRAAVQPGHFDYTLKGCCVGASSRSPCRRHGRPATATPSGICRRSRASSPIMPTMAGTRATQRSWRGSGAIISGSPGSGRCWQHEQGLSGAGSPQERRRARGIERVGQADET